MLNAGTKIVAIYRLFLGKIWFKGFALCKRIDISQNFATLIHVPRTSCSFLLSHVSSFKMQLKSMLTYITHCPIQKYADLDHPYIYHFPSIIIIYVSNRLTTHISFNVITYLMLTCITQTFLYVIFLTYITHCMPTWLTHTSIYCMYLSWFETGPLIWWFIFCWHHPDLFTCNIFDLHHPSYADLAHPYIYHFLNIMCIYADLNHQGPRSKAP